MIKKEKYPKVDKKYLTKNIQKKQYFETIKKIIINDKKKSGSIMDIGCASGDFLTLFKNKPQYSLHGFDYSNALIKLAKKKLPVANFNVENILSPKNKKKFDYCVCLGVLNIFNDFKKPLKNILKFVKKGGLLFIFTHINYYNINVRVQFQKTENRHWYSGVNSFSKLALQEFFIKNKKIKKFKIIKHQLKQTIRKNKKNPMHAWTVTLDGKKSLISGAGIVYDQAIIVIQC
jgi:ubiquinone/menaquinone biosynthesis C-methylase UbiE